MSGNLHFATQHLAANAYPSTGLPPTSAWALHCMHYDVVMAVAYEFFCAQSIGAVCADLLMHALLL